MWEEKGVLEGKGELCSKTEDGIEILRLCGRNVKIVFCGYIKEGDS